MQFKELELSKKKGSGLSQIIKAPRTRITLIAILIGAIAGFLFYYISEGRLLVSMPGKEIIKSLLIGGFFGFFVTNSPCARGRC